MKWLVAILFAGVLVFSSIGAVAFINDNENVKSIEESVVFSNPNIVDSEQYVMINLEEATSFILQPGNPKLPVVTKVFTFPFGTKIKNVDVSFSNTNEVILNKEIQTVTEPVPISMLSQATSEPILYENQEIYPKSNYNFDVATGIGNNERFVYCVLQLYPVRYTQSTNTISYSNNANIKITYEEPTNPATFDDTYDLVIITPSEYTDELQPLVNHKNSYGMDTVVKTTQEIYGEYQGVDEAEKIKYFIKDAIETWGVEYVLLIGSIDKLPIRTTYPGWWGEGDVLCDLYYSDIYNETGDFCDWDGNDNGVFGEVYQDHHNTYDLDDLDLFPDVHLGRLACMDSSEVNIVVDKIIAYESETYGKSWFNNIVLIGGDTFPDHQQGGNEGEELNLIIEDIMSDFTSTKLWTSTNTFSAFKINQAINSGAGFVDYSGHGFEYGMGTHPPEDESWKFYMEINLLGLSNGYKLPIVFFDACLTSRLDFNKDDNSRERTSSIPRIFNLPIVKNIISPITRILRSFLTRITSDPAPSPKEAELRPCFAWNWINKDNGGAIADVGATRTAFGGFDSGAGKLSIEFFSTYESSEYLGQMMTECQKGYNADVPWDLFTLEEFILLGDPSLKIGGYP